MVKLNVLPAGGEDDGSDGSGATKEDKVTMVVDEKPFPAILLLFLLAALGVLGWLGVRMALRCPLEVYVNEKPEGRFNLMNEATLPEQVTKMGAVTVKAGRKGIMAVKVANPGMKLRCEPSGEEKDLVEGKTVLLRELFGEAKAESTKLTLIEPSGTKCEIKVK